MRTVPGCGCFFAFIFYSLHFGFDSCSETSILMNYLGHFLQVRDHSAYVRRLDTMLVL